MGLTLVQSLYSNVKKKKRERKRMSQRVTNYVGFWQIVALLYKSSNISFVTVWSVSAGTERKALHLRHNLIALRPTVVVEATCPGTALLICFNLIVRQLGESINRLSLICKWCVFVKQGVESGGRDFKFSPAWTMWPYGDTKSRVLLYRSCKPRPDPQEM